MHFWKNQIWKLFVIAFIPWSANTVQGSRDTDKVEIWNCNEPTDRPTESEILTISKSEIQTTSESEIQTISESETQTTSENEIQTISWIFPDHLGY